EFRRALEIDPAFYPARYHLGVALHRMGLSKDAVSAYEMALRLRPRTAEAQYGLSAVCAELGDRDGAIQLLREVVSASPRQAETHYNLGLNLWNRYKAAAGPRRKADFEEAAAQLETAARLDPGPARHHAALGQLRGDNGQFAEAAASIRKA